jgi:hypothetical protein
VLLGLLTPSAAGAAERRAMLVFVERASLSELARLPGASVGLAGATQGRYRRTQALLDVSQGSRTSLNAYDPTEPPRLRFAGGRVIPWEAVVERAEAAPAEVVPGLLASSVPTGYIGPSRGEALAATDRDGRYVTGERALTVRLVPDVASIPLPRGTLVIAVETPSFSERRAQLLPLAVIGLGPGRQVTSSTTRTDGMVTLTDLGPTILRWLGRPLPDEMQGRPIRLDGAIDLERLADLEARLRVISGRRLPLLGTLGGAWLVLLGVLAAFGRARTGLRIGALALLWVLPALLATAALAPSRWTELLLVTGACLGLAALTDRLVPWPRGPLVPAAVGVVAYLVDLAFGSPLITQSLFGPNPLFGARFYGVGNELESTLPVLALAATAAALVPRGRSREAALAFAGTGAVVGLGLAAGRLGADVGAVITVGAGTSVAVALAAPGRMTWQRAALVVAVPLAGLAVLALLDLATGGDAHFTRTVLRADDSEALGEVVARRYELALDVLLRPAMLVLTPLCLAAVWLGIRHRDALLQGVPGAPVWGAALAGAAAGGIAGALSNDSGPLLLVFSVVLTAWIAVYLRAGPGRAD